MKKVVTILLLSVYILETSNLIQVVKLPLLIEHYIKHKKEDPSITVAQFLKLHYGIKQPIDADYQEDMQLPFKTLDFTFVFISPTVLPPAAGFSFEYPDAAGINYPLQDTRFPLFHFPHKVFQPPQA